MAMKNVIEIKNKLDRVFVVRLGEQIMISVCLRWREGEQVKLVFI
jgi:hypothetical protein